VVRARSDRAVIVGLLALLTFSPCEGFLPVYLTGIRYGWAGFALLSVVLALATVTGMVIFTWLTLTGLERLKLEAVERVESGILGAVLCTLGLAVMVFE
jgi:nickel/cobalt exporter